MIAAFSAEPQETTIDLQVGGYQVDSQVQNLSNVIQQHDIPNREQIIYIGRRRVASWMYKQEDGWVDVQIGRWMGGQRKRMR